MTSPVSSPTSGQRNQSYKYSGEITPEGMPSHRQGVVTRGSGLEGKHASPTVVEMLMAKKIANGEEPSRNLIHELQRSPSFSCLSDQGLESGISLLSSQREGVQRRQGYVAKDSYHKAIRQLALVSLFMVGAFYLFLDPLTFNVLGLFVILGVYFSSQLYTEYANNYWHYHEVHHSELSVFYGAIAISHAFIALRYLTLLAAFPGYTLSLFFVSTTFILLNGSRCKRFAEIERNINSRNY
jgi:hypothetical protein